MSNKMTETAEWLVAAAGAACGAAAAWVVLPGLYNTVQYRVEVQPAAPAMNQAVFALPAVAIAAAVVAAARAGKKRAARAAAVSLAPLLANVFTLIRAWSGAKPFYLEPLLLCLSVAASVAVTLSHLKRRPEDSPPDAEPKNDPSGVAALAFAALAAVWLFFLQDAFLSKLAFGWTDVGLNYLRVKNTALGQGFLQETMARPPFYDHFNAGLAVLVPFYYCFRSFDLIMWAQGLFLAAVGPAVFVYARGRGLGGWTSFLFSAAAVLHPSVSQMAFSFSYGFHPGTLALPAVVLSIHFWEKRRWALFALCALFAASMEETLFPLYAGVGLVELVFPHGRRVSGAVLFGTSVAAFLVVTKVIMPAVVGDAEYFQMVKFAHLGEGVGAILLSPFTKPGVFWGLIFSGKSFVFMALILGAMGFLPLLAPRQFLYPAVVLVFVLLLDNPDVKSISFWYQGLILVTWFPAMAAGAQTLGRWWKSKGARCPTGAIAAAALVAAVGVSHFHGMLPWSRLTVPFQTRRSEEFMRDVAELRAFAENVSADARVLATMRAATLFCDAGLSSPLQDWNRGTDYDVVVLQRDDVWGQSPEYTKEVFDAFVGTGEFELKSAGRFVILTRRGAGL